MQHLFLTHSIKQLLDLKTTLQGTLKNPVCEVLATPVTDTINQIDEELKQRGIYPLRQFYNPAFEVAVVNQIS